MGDRSGNKRKDERAKKKWKWVRRVAGKLER